MKVSFTKIITIAMICGMISCSNSGSSESEENTNIVPTPTNAVTRTSTPEPTITAIPIIQADPLPRHLGLVIPEPGVYSLAEYNTQAIETGWGANRPGICMDFRGSSSLLEEGDILTNIEDYLHRISVTVNGTNLNEIQSMLTADSLGWENKDPDTGRVIWRTPDGIPAQICYSALLEAGFYEATISVERTTLEPVTYTWSFLIEP